jgi:hypothetical protein
MVWVFTEIRKAEGGTDLSEETVPVVYILMFNFL